MWHIFPGMLMVTSSTRGGVEMGLQAQLNSVARIDSKKQEIAVSGEIHSAQTPAVQVVVGAGLLSK